MAARRPSPDYRRLVAVMTGNSAPDRLPFIDLRADDAVVERIAGEPLNVGDTSPQGLRRRADLLVRCALALDFDMVWARVSVPFKRALLRAADTAESTGEREWVNTHGTGLTSREAFERFPWPQPGVVDTAIVEVLAQRVPDGMGIFTTTSGVLENTLWLMGMEGLAYALVDDPALVADVFSAVGLRFLEQVKALAALPCVQAIWVGDDMGHRHGLLVPPAVIRTHVFPWLRQAIEAAHARDKPFVLHSCGNMYELMDDVIAMGVDAKHSFEDAILPVGEALRRYGTRISLLGGVDMHTLAHGTEEGARSAARAAIEACADSGRWALGSGNSFANYIPVRNYLAMLDEGRRTWP